MTTGGGGNGVERTVYVTVQRVDELVRRAEATDRRLDRTETQTVQLSVLPVQLEALRSDIQAIRADLRQVVQDQNDRTQWLEQFKIQMQQTGDSRSTAMKSSFLTVFGFGIGVVTIIVNVLVQVALRGIK